MNTDIRIKNLEPYFIDTTCRVPLKFGAVVVEECTFCQIKATVENRMGKTAEGWGAIFLMDMWAYPTTAVSHEKKDLAMKELVGRLVELFKSNASFGHPVDLFMEVEGEFDRIKKDVCRDMNLAEEMPFLGALVSASPIDAALHDAFGIVNEISTYDGYSSEYMKYDLSKYLGSNYKGIYIGDFIKKKYDEKIPVFHLVGGLDKLRRSELDASDPKDDLPNTLDEWIEKDGLICLKVKLKGTDLDWDINRTLEVVNIAHEIKDRAGNSTLYFSADTNEQCEHPDYIVEYLRKIREKSERAYRELLYVEQPTERDLRLHRFDMTKAAALKPVILDESLTGLEDLKLARSLGWSGIALKACKCQTHSLIFASMAEKEGFPYTVQDLTNIGISLIQSVGLAARLNPMMGVEANSRQFFPDASKPEAVVHPGIYTRKDGMLDTGSMKGFGLGYQIEKINRKLG